MQLTKKAEEHFSALLEKESKIENAKVNLRIEVESPGTTKANVHITFCIAGMEQKNDLKINFEKYDLFIDKDSIDCLKDACIDYKNDKFNSELSIKAPNLKGYIPPDDSPMIEKIKYVIDTKIAPGLASHKGFVKLIDYISSESKVLLEFGGGCQGCSMSSMTLKNSIEQTLKAHFSEIKVIEDVTEHEKGETPYC